MVQIETPAAALGDPELSLAFTNTVNWHGLTGRHAAKWATWSRAAEFVDLLPSYGHLVSWAQRRAAISSDQAVRLSALASQQPGTAAGVLEQARRLREAIYRIFSATSEGVAPDAADLAAVNDALPAVLRRLRLRMNGSGGMAWEWEDDPKALDRMLWPVLWSAVQLMTTDALPRVRECANDPCGWLFLDTSRNRSRRWCSMDLCGNRVKARRHHARARAERQPE